MRILAIPLYADHLGASAATIGLLFTAYNVPAAVLAIPGGLIADRFGRRALLTIGLSVGLAGQLAAGLTSSVAVLLLTQILGGVGVGVTQVIVMAALADSVPRQRLGGALAWFAVCMQAGLLMGPAIGGVALGAVGNQFGVLMILSSVPTFGIAILLTALFLPARSTSHGAEPSVLQPLRRFLAAPSVWALVVALLAICLVWGTNQGYIAVLSTHVFGLPASQVGFLLAVQSVASVVFRLPAGRLVDRFPQTGKLVVPSVVGFAACQVVLPHVSGFWAPALVLIVSMPLSGVAMTALGVLFAEAGQGGGTGTAMGFFSAVLFAGLAAGPALFGPLMNSGFSLGFTASAVAAMALAVATTRVLSGMSRLGRAAQLDLAAV